MFPVAFDPHEGKKGDVVELRCYINHPGIIFPWVLKSILVTGDFKIAEITSICSGKKLDEAGELDKVLYMPALTAKHKRVPKISPPVYRLWQQADFKHGDMSLGVGDGIQLNVRFLEDGVFSATLINESVDVEVSE